MNLNSSEQATGQGTNSLLSMKNIVIAVIILFVGFALGATFAPRFSFLSTFLAGAPQGAEVPAGSRHIAVKVNNVVTTAGQTESTSLYLENQSASEEQDNLCSFFVVMKYDAAKMKVKNLAQSETLPKEFDSFNAQDDSANNILKVSGSSKDCSAKMTPQVMEIATFDVEIASGATPGYSAFEVIDTGTKDSSQVVDSKKTDIMMLNDNTEAGVYVSDGGEQTLTSASPVIVSAQKGGTVTVQGTNVYSLYYIQGADDNVDGSKAYYFQNVVPGYTSVQGLLAGGMAPGQYKVCAHSLFGIAGENVCSATSLLTVQ